MKRDRDEFRAISHPDRPPAFHLGYWDGYHQADPDLPAEAADRAEYKAGYASGEAFWLCGSAPLYW